MLDRGNAACWLLALLPALSMSVACSQDVVGVYQHEGMIAATLEVERNPGGYAVRFQGGSSSEGGPAVAADCVIQAAGQLKGDHLLASFGPVETETFSYDAAQAEREGRVVEIVFDRGSAQVAEADVFGYCGLGAEFTGTYRKTEAVTAIPPLARTASAAYLQDLLASAGPDVARAEEISARIRLEMDRRGVPADVSVSDFVWRPDPKFEQPRLDVATALGWQP